MSQQINLFNENPRQKGGNFSVRNMVQALAVILVFIAVFYAYSAYRVNELSDRIEQVKNKQAEEQKRLATLTAEFLHKRAGLTLEQELKNVTAEVNAQREIINALKSGVIGNTRGYSHYMQAFARQMVNGLWLTGFSIEGDAMQMSISGAALRPELVPAYIMRLNNENALRGKTFASLQMQLSEKGEGRETKARYLEFVLKSVASSEADK